MRETWILYFPFQLFYFFFNILKYFICKTYVILLSICPGSEKNLWVNIRST